MRTIELDIDLISEELYLLLLEEFKKQHPSVGNLDNWVIKADKEEELNELQKALLWFQQNGIESFEDDGIIYIWVNHFYIEVSANEVSYRAELWDDSVNQGILFSN